MRGRWAGSLGVALACWLAAARADDGVGTAPVPAPIAVSRPAPAAVLMPPVASLGRPVARPTSPCAVTTSSYTPDGIVRVQALDPPPPSPPPSSVIPPVPTAPYDPILPGPPPVGGGSPTPSGPGFWGQTREWTGTFEGSGRKLFQSDHAFDNLISPVTSPFLDEDPRSLTEVRPIFMYQSVSKKNWVYRGGSVDFFGTQARVAVTERFSVVMNKLGWIWNEPNSQDEIGKHDGFAELWIGPKYTFYRCEDTKTVAAGGITFQIPTGDAKVFQNTGTLGVTPYVSAAQSFGKSSYGSFDAMGTMGYAFSTDQARTEYFFLDAHLDYDVLGAHKFYPLIEMNWIHYSRAGNSVPAGFEGGDLINFGSQGVSGSNLLTLGFGARYKFSECVQLGTAFEFPLVGGNTHILDWRWTIDMIFRY